MKKNLRTKLQRQYNKLKKVVNPILSRPFENSKKSIQFGGTRGKSIDFLRTQIKTMERIIKEENKYGVYARAHRYKLNYYRILKDVDEDVANRIKAMSSKKFQEFYDWAVENGYDSAIFDFNDFYFEYASGEEQLETAYELDYYLDEFYGIEE